MIYKHNLPNAYFKPSTYLKPNVVKTALIRVLFSMLIVVIFALLTNTVMANAAVIDTDSASTNEPVNRPNNRPGNKPDLNSTTHGSVWLLPSDGMYIEALQLKTNVQMNVSGLIVRAKVKQQFKNVSSFWAEGLYVFPLPENAAVDHFRMMIDGQVIEGQIQEKAQARKTYEKAKRNGQRSGLVEQQRANIFITRLANIAPGSKISVEIEYQQTLVYRDGLYSLRYPLLVGPRYITPSAEGLNDPEYDLGVHTETSTGANNINPTSISVNIDTGILVTKIISNSHEVLIDSLGENKYVVSLRDDNVPADRDFLLQWQPALDKLPTVAVFKQQHEGYDYSLLTIYPPADDFYSTQDIPREVVFVLDVSGSMSGTSIEQAKIALSLALERLNPWDKFNIIWFNNEAHKVFDNAQQANVYNVRYARQFVASLNADGGTEMLPALKLAFSMPSDPAYLRQIIFLTDGNISNERDLFAYIKSNLAEARLFTVGIGSAPNGLFMKRAATAGRGSYTFISNMQHVAEKMQLLFHKLESPALTDIEITLTGDDIEFYQNPIPDMYIGVPITVLLRGKNLSKSIRFNGNIGVNKWQYTASLDTGYDNDGIRTAWAREKIRSLSEFYHDAENKSLKQYFKDQIIHVSQTHHLVSQYTSLVAVDVTPVNQSGMIYRENIKNNRPYGWTAQQNDKLMLTRIRLPQTATAAPMHVLLMLVFLAFSFLLNTIRITIQRAGMEQAGISQLGIKRVVRFAKRKHV